MDIFAFRDKKIVTNILDNIKSISQDKSLANEKIKIMHVCGTHEHSIAKFNLRALLPENIDLIAGPGCPVCVCPAQDVQYGIEIAMRPDCILTTFGDMIRVPVGTITSRDSLEKAKARGANVEVVYSSIDALNIARKNPSKEVVFFAIGFETTAVTNAGTLVDPNLPKNFSIISSMRIVPPAIDALLQIPATKDCSYILPGHVTTVMGLEEYEYLYFDHGLSMSVAGFEPVDILRSIEKILLRKLGRHDKNIAIDNCYERAVTKEGNKKAKTVLKKFFQQEDAVFRGLGKIPRAGLGLKPEYANLDAVKKFNLKETPNLNDTHPSCLCAEVLLGTKKPKECKLFGKTCTPNNPFGACMVSFEGTCANAYKYLN